MTTKTFRYVDYRLRHDETAEIEFEARCVFGDEVECGAESGAYSTAAGIEEWQRKHTQETRHTRYRRSRSDYQVWEPTEYVPPPVQPEQAPEAVRP